MGALEVPSLFQPLMKCNCLTDPSARAEMTIPSEDRDLLIILASSSTVPSAPVFPTFETQTQQLSWWNITDCYDFKGQRCL